MVKCLHVSLYSNSLESEEERDECGESSSDEEDEDGGLRVSDKQHAEANDVGKVAENPRLCGWVPTQCCLIPLPESPGPSDDEREGEEEGGEREPAASGPLSESELQRQHERELEVLFGFKPAPPPSAEDHGPPMSEEKGGGKKDRNIEGDVFDENDKEMVHQVVVGNVPKARSNSADSGVVSISPHSSEGGDMEQRPMQNQTVVFVTSEEHKVAISTKNTRPTPAETGTDNAQTKLECVASEQGGDLNSTLEKPSQRPCLPVSRLRTPSEKLQKCSIFTGSVSLIHCMSTPLI